MNRSPFTAQELIYPAHGARALAYRAQEDGARQGTPSIRESFANEDRLYRGLAAKCERLAREPGAAPDALELPVFRQPPPSPYD
jgi:hypothetical protein